MSLFNGNNSGDSNMECKRSVHLACDDEVFRAEMYSNKALEELSLMRKQNILCDVTLIAGDVRINAHRIQLSTCSPYFRTMFTTSFKETSQNEIVINDVDSQCLEQLVDYLYTGEICLSEDNVTALLSAANLFQITDVKDGCSSFLEERLHVTNCVSIRAFANLFDCTELESKANTYMITYFSEVIKGEDFLKLSVDEVSEFIQTEDIVCDEEEVFDCVVDWIKYDCEGRKFHLPILMECLRLVTMNPNFLKQKLNERLLQENPECMKKVENALSYLATNTENQPTLDTTLISPRNMKTLVVMDRMTMRVECYYFGLRVWTPMKRPEQRMRSALGTVNGRLYLLGGMKKHDTLNKVEMFNVHTNNWEVAVPMISKRRLCGTATLNGKMYAIGGFDDQGVITSAEVFNPVTQTWKSIAFMARSRDSFGVGVLNNKIYVVGGGSRNELLNTVECYDPETDKWHDVAKMSRCRKDVGVCVLNGLLYAIGGHDGSHHLNLVEVYDPVADVWSSVASLSNGRTCPGAVSYDGKLFVAGGWDGGSPLLPMETYSPETDTWVWRTVDMSHVTSHPIVAIVNQMPLKELPFRR